METASESHVAKYHSALCWCVCSRPGNLVCRPGNLGNTPWLNQVEGDEAPRCQNKPASFGQSLGTRRKDEIT